MTAVDTDLHRKHTVIIGGGLAALAAAHDLSKAEGQVTVLERAADFGGLASSFRLDGHPVERFYHFVCRADHELQRLLDELRLSHHLAWRETRTAFYHEGRYYRFGRPPDLLRFTPVPWLQRLRFGYHILRSRYRTEWRWLDQLPAKPWLIENIGKDAYDAIWDPLLRVKFGRHHESVSAAWIWHRIWRVATSRRSLFSSETFGYLQHGSATLTDALVERLRKRDNVSLQNNIQVESIDVREGAAVAVVHDGGQRLTCDSVVSTVALPVLDRLIAPHSDPFFRTLSEIEYIGVVCMVLSLKHPFTNNFWTNVNDPRISFNGIIEQTNLNANLREAGLNVLYVPFYLPTDEPRFSATDAELLAEYVPMLKILNPDFSADWIKEWHVFRARHAQAVFVTNFASKMPSHRSSIKDLYITDSTQFYPEDRTISSAIAQGRIVARMILEDRGR